MLAGQQHIIIPSQAQSSDLVMSSCSFSIQPCWDDALGNSPLVPEVLSQGLCAGQEGWALPPSKGSSRAPTNSNTRGQHVF